MKLRHSLIAAVAVTISVCTSQAEPKDWVGKRLPKLDAKFLETAPSLTGHPAIIEFWATWCPPCRASIPHLNQINKKYKNQGLVVIGITNESKADVEEFRKKTIMEYNVAIAPENKLAGTLGVGGIPQAFVVGKHGKIVWEGHPMGLTDEVIQKALK